MSIKFDLTTSLVEDITQLQRTVGLAIVDELNIRLKKVAVKIKRNVKTILLNALKNQPEYESIINGELREQFGIPDGADKLNVIISTWINTVSIKMKKFTLVGPSLINGGLRVEAIRSNFEDVMDLDAAYQITEKGENLHWLYWLLLAGDRIIIADYNIVEGGLFHGRAGSKIMRKTPGGKWSVPMAYRGTKNNNWVTRAIDAADKEFRAIFEGTF